MSALCLALCLAQLAGCYGPQSTVVVDNDYPPKVANPLTVYLAYWQAVPFQEPIVPSSSSSPQPTVPTSDSTAYVALAPGWDPLGSAPPTSLVLLRSRNGFGVHLGDTLHIPVDDSTFMGNCASGSFLSQAQADFITARIFTPTLFPGAPLPLRYEASTCTATLSGDAGLP